MPALCIVTEILDRRLSMDTEAGASKRCFVDWSHIWTLGEPIIPGLPPGSPVSMLARIMLPTLVCCCRLAFLQCRTQRREDWISAGARARELGASNCLAIPSIPAGPAVRERLQSATLLDIAARDRPHARVSPTHARLGRGQAGKAPLCDALQTTSSLPFVPMIRNEDRSKTPHRVIEKY